jgi:hypothetical protein
MNYAADHADHAKLLGVFNRAIVIGMGKAELAELMNKIDSIANDEGLRLVMNTTLDNQKQETQHG